MLARWISLAGMAIVLMAGVASAADVRVMISAGFYGVYAELGPAFEHASGHRLVTTRGPSMGDSLEAELSLYFARPRPSWLNAFRVWDVWKL